MIFAYKSPRDGSVRAIRKTDFNDDPYGWDKACRAAANLDTATWCFRTEQEFRDFAPDGVEMYDHGKDSLAVGVAR